MNFSVIILSFITLLNVGIARAASQKGSLLFYSNSEQKVQVSIQNNFNVKNFSKFLKNDFGFKLEDFDNISKKHQSYRYWENTLPANPELVCYKGPLDKSLLGSIAWYAYQLNQTKVRKNKDVVSFSTDTILEESSMNSEITLKIDQAHLSKLEGTLKVELFEEPSGDGLDYAFAVFKMKENSISIYDCHAEGGSGGCISRSISPCTSTLNK